MKKNKNLKNSIFFNEEETLKSLYLRAQRDGYPSQQEKRDTNMNNKWFKALATLAVVASAVFIFTLMNNPSNESIIESKTVIAYVSVDINPSFEISVYDDNTVESINQLNEDALTIDVSDLIGMNVDLAIEAIVERATAAGFINLDDIEDDYILLTTVATDESTVLQQDQLQTMIQDRIHISETLNSVYVVELKTDLQTKFEADGKNVPVGLYVINGEVLQEDGSYLTVKEIFSNTEKISELQHTYQFNISTISSEQLITNIRAILDKLIEEGIDVSTYEITLASADIDGLHDLHDFLITEYAALIHGTQMNQSDNNQQNEDPGSDNSSQADPNKSESAPASKENSSSNQGGKNS